MIIMQRFQDQLRVLQEQVKEKDAANEKLKARLHRKEKREASIARLNELENKIAEQLGKTGPAQTPLVLTDTTQPNLCLRLKQRLHKKKWNFRQLPIKGIDHGKILQPQIHALRD